MKTSFLLYALFIAVLYSHLSAQQNNKGSFAARYKNDRSKIVPGLSKIKSDEVWVLKII